MDRVNHDPSKNQLRKRLRETRKLLTEQEQNAAAHRLVRHLLTSPFLRSSRRIACYLPNDGEIDPTPLIERLWAMKRQCFLPVLSRLPRDRLWFAPILPDTPLVLNRFGIPEPAVTARALLRAQELDLILMPLVGFDVSGNRLGMGGGFYDRSLEFLRHRGAWHKPRLVGLAHECQRLEALTPEPWDIPLRGIVTDRAIYLAD